MTPPKETTKPHPDSDEFEFGRFPPDSPTGQSTDQSSSPADHLFSNGRLLPHSFPLPMLVHNNKKEFFLSPPSDLSLLSSRSNSVSSSSSSVTTARSSLSTSSSSSSSDHNRRLVSSSKLAGRKQSTITSTPVASKVVMAQLYGDSSQRWQHLVPPLRSRSGRVVGKGGKSPPARKKKQPAGSSGGGGDGFCRKLLRWLLVACRECHALEPSPSRS
ncbi:unnamed protein product [Linum tenue]|uniref:Uncharacterized protein n=1 Tax=Linum tenue TaxID=586396 RepID=A0AAV0JEU5_9ROSI|nr:unnamed protein product [Linum tenue]CAI0409248.1 unnamed protein product [Linum tenue]